MVSTPTMVLFAFEQSPFNNQKVDLYFQFLLLKCVSSSLKSGVLIMTSLNDYMKCWRERMKTWRSSEVLKQIFFCLITRICPLQMSFSKVVHIHPRKEKVPSPTNFLVNKKAGKAARFRELAALCEKQRLKVKTSHPAGCYVKSDEQLLQSCSSRYTQR